MRQTTDTDSERNEGKTKTHIFQLIDGIERGASARRRSHVVVIVIVVVVIRTSSISMSFFHIKSAPLFFFFSLAIHHYRVADRVLFDFNGQKPHNILVDVHKTFHFGNSG